MILKSGYYGTPWAQSLANTVDGGVSFLSVEYWFTPLKDALGIDTLRGMDIINKAGYAAGTNGTAELMIQDDDFPVRMLLPLTSNWPVLKPPRLLNFHAGKTYQLVFSNIDPRPDLNYFSPDALLGAPSPFIVPGWAVGYADAHGVLTMRPGYLPIFSLENSADPTQHVGMEYMEVELSYFKPGRLWRQAVPPTAITAYNYRTADGGTQREVYDTSQTVTSVPIYNPAVLLRKGTQQGFPDPLPGSFAQYSDDQGVTWQATTTLVPALPCDLQFALELA